MNAPVLLPVTFNELDGAAERLVENHIRALAMGLGTVEAKLDTLYRQDRTAFDALATKLYSALPTERKYYTPREGTYLSYSPVGSTELYGIDDMKRSGRVSDELHGRYSSQLNEAIMIPGVIMEELPQRLPEVIKTLKAACAESDSTFSNYKPLLERALESAHVLEYELKRPVPEAKAEGAEEVPNLATCISYYLLQGDWLEHNRPNHVQKVVAKAGGIVGKILEFGARDQDSDKGR